MWQFTRGTRRQSAGAAARMLRDNFNVLRDWPLAVTAYNHGRPRMMRAKGEHGADLVTIIND